MKRLAILVLGALVTATCGDGLPTAPSGGDSASGVWIGYSTLTAVSGGECVGSTLQDALKSRDIFTAHLKQTGSRVNATLTYEGNGTDCELTGTTSGENVTLHLASCQAGRVVGMQCGNGAVRDLQMLTHRIVATATPSRTGTGIETSTWSVLASGTADPVGLLTLTAEFTWNAEGLPHTHFHVFDGSISRGYVDGTVTIPEEPYIFCTDCGWLPSQRGEP